MKIRELMENVDQQQEALKVVINGIVNHSPSYYSFHNKEWFILGKNNNVQFNARRPISAIFHIIDKDAPHLKSYIRDSHNAYHIYKKAIASAAVKRAKQDFLQNQSKNVADNKQARIRELRSQITDLQNKLDQLLSDE